MTFRKRRIASDEAHSWARNLRLGNNWAAKYVLCMMTLYVNGDGICFVSVGQLAEDCELAQQTVRRRLAWLESVGVISRRGQWIDEHGKRNSEGRGRRTSDEIMLLLDADPDQIEAKAGVSDTAPQEGPNDERDSADPTAGTPLALPVREVPESSEPEPEQEESPPTPPSGGSIENFDEWKEFEADWQEPIVRQSLAQQVWAALTAEERAAARQAARGYVAWRKAQKKPPNVLGAHLFLRERGAWAKFAEMTKKSGGIGDIAPKSPEFRAIAFLYELAGRASAIRGFMQRSDGGLYYRHVVTPQLLAFAETPPRSEWPALTIPQATAYNEIIDEYVMLGSKAHMRPGDRAPWPWPPSKDGKIYSTGPPSSLMTEQDERDASNMKW